MSKTELLYVVTNSVGVVLAAYQDASEALKHGDAGNHVTAISLERVQEDPAPFKPGDYVRHKEFTPVRQVVSMLRESQVTSGFRSWVSKPGKPSGQWFCGFNREGHLPKGYVEAKDLVKVPQ